MYAIDTNILFRYILEDDQEQVAQVHGLFAHLANLNIQAVVTCTVCTELEYLLQKVAHFDKETTIRIFRELIQKSFLCFDEEVIRAVNVFSEINTDFSDIVIGEYGRTQGCITLSFDKKSCNRLDSFSQLSQVDFS